MKPSDFKIKTGSAFRLIGVAEGKGLKKLEEEVKFVEDLTPDEIAKARKDKFGAVLPVGIVNLGNTCYMNSTL